MFDTIDIHSQLPGFVAGLVTGSSITFLGHRLALSRINRKVCLEHRKRICRIIDGYRSFTGYCDTVYVVKNWWVEASEDYSRFKRVKIEREIEALSSIDFPESTYDPKGLQNNKLPDFSYARGKIS